MKYILTVLKLPYWLLSPITQAKSFKDNPVIGSKFLNVFGLHVKRILLARLSASFRWFFLAPLMPKKLRAEYHQNGFVVIENFLLREEVAALKNDISHYKAEAREMRQGDTATQRILLDQTALKNMRHVRLLTESNRLHRYLSYTGAKIAAPLLYVQRIRNGYQSGGSDPQKNMHSDTFHPTMKAWIFLEDVTDDMGPFTYVKGSNRLTIKRLKWEYGRSINAASMNDKYSEKGSLRATAEDLEEMGLPSPQGITAKAGTLVIANTNGFHGRGQAQAGASRLELWAYSRHNPFNPFPGIKLPFAAKIKHKAMHIFWQRADKKAAARNSKASWYKIPAEEMVDGL